MSKTPEIFQFLGRLHTVVLHLPIGILFLAFIMEISSRFSTFEKVRPTIPFVLFLGMIAAVITAIFGYLLSQEGGYEERLLWNHKWLGIATAGLSVILFIFRKKKILYLLTFTGLIILLIFTGHNGGSITHGSNFLFEPFEEKILEEEFVGNIMDIKVYAQLIQPIFKSKCVSCHNAGKVKGGLILTDTMAILKGGDTGPAFIARQPASSLLLKAIHLPLEDEKHMPPKGKKQLSEEDQKLLRWWIFGASEFTKTVTDYPIDPEIEAILKNRFVRKKAGIETINIDPVGKSKLTLLNNKGLNVVPLGSGSPWLEARLSDRKKLSADHFKLLKKVAENITILDLGNTPFDDKSVQHINAFPNLSKLFLDQTKISDTGFKNIKPLINLVYLNLYACNISDESIPVLKQFKNLKSLYLWQTQISPEGIANLKKEIPELIVITGKENKETFAKAQLRAPQILADSNMFIKELRVELKLNFPWAKVYYTLDGSTPDSSSLLYEKPFVISNSTTIKTIATAESWESSTVAEATFLSIKKRLGAIAINQAPDSSYKGEGAQTLIDLKLGSSDFKDGKWLAWQGKSITAVLDFEKPVDISTLFVSALDNNSSWIFFPKQLKVWISIDNKNFTLVATEQFDVPSVQKTPSLRKFKATFKKTRAQYIKVFIENVTKNPEWHPAAGQPSWLFLDEIIVE
ncbi:MAG: putative membrane protein [Saprospiraceae bacterium]|jgi:uncharacterized membrane protein